MGWQRLPAWFSGRADSADGADLRGGGSVGRHALRPPLPQGSPDAEIYAHIQSLAGMHFDPQVVQVFVERVR